MAASLQAVWAAALETIHKAGKFSQNRKSTISEGSCPFCSKRVLYFWSKSATIFVIIPLKKESRLGGAPEIRKEDAL
jgi:hypothetical protein